MASLRTNKLFIFDIFPFFQGSVVAMSTFYPLDTARHRLQGLYTISDEMASLGFFFWKKW